MTSHLDYFSRKKWTPHDFQIATWEAYNEGKSGLLHAPTGLGKTLAVWMAPVKEALEENKLPKTCRVLWITPLRALAADTQRSLQEPLDQLDLPLEVGIRTGDTSSYRKAKLREKLPFALVTTPESLSLMLTYEDTREKLSELRCIVVDEWHELHGTKRGVQTELCLARIKSFAPQLRVWGISATLGNLAEASEALIASYENTVRINSELQKPLQIDTIIPKEIDSFPWAGHLGIRLAKRVIEEVENAQSTLIFTNTRSQTEIWHQTLLDSAPHLEAKIAIHHSSIDRDQRLEVERALLEGELRAVVCTSSLDLGIDFAPVDQVIQIGSPKGIARLLQRAGRSGHQPGRTSRLLCVPTNSLELLEFAAAKDAVDRKEIESKRPLHKPLDLLIQHLITCAIGENIDPHKFYITLRETRTYSALTEEEWKWIVTFVTDGGGALSSYPQYRKLVWEDETLRLTDKRMIQLHRMNIGTITSDITISLVFSSGRRIGSVEEGFIAKLKPGSQFIFSGKQLELVRVRQLVATVKIPTNKKRGEVVIWGGSKMPLSTELSRALARRLSDHTNLPDRPEHNAVLPLLKIQNSWSQVPTLEELQIEHTQSKQGDHLIFFTFAGRLVNEGLGTLVAHRLTEGESQSIQITQNDYAFCLSSPKPLPCDEDIFRSVLTTEDLLEHLLSCLNTHELGKRKFREIARIACLIQQTQPGRSARPKDIQTSASLLYEVFSQYDPGNLLLAQSKKEILEGQLEFSRLQAALIEIETKNLRIIETKHLSPMAFPLWAERLHSTISTQDAASLLEEMLTELETAASQVSE